MYFSCKTLSSGNHRHERHRPSLPNLDLKGQTTAKTAVKTKLFERFFEYLKGYEAILEKLLPKVAIKFYKTFSNGAKLLFRDMNDFLWVYHVLSSTTNWENACKSLSRKQLELYLTLPAELRRVAPVLAISAFPMAQNVIFPLALWAPKRLLSVHFWSDEIKKEVEDERVKHRHLYYRSVFKKLVSMQTATSSSDKPSPSQVKNISLTLKGPDNRNQTVRRNDISHEKAQLAYKNNMQLLTAGQHPNANEIVKMMPVFQNVYGSLGLTQLSGVHVRYLLKIHNSKHVGMTSWWFPRRKLQVYANMILEIDKAIQREGLEVMSFNDWLDCCQVRGLNVNGVSEGEIGDYLQNWIRVSTQLNEHSCSLLLHLPIFLGYNKKSRYWNKKTMGYFL